MGIVNVSIDFWSGKARFEEGMMEWLMDHDNDIERWLHENTASEADRDAGVAKIIGNTTLSYFFYIYMNSLKKYSDPMDVIVTKLCEAGTIVMITGNRGSGKTAFSMALLARARKRGKKLVYFGPPGKLPPIFDCRTLSWDNIPPNSLVFVDEIGLLQFSRNAMTREQMDVVQRIPIIRHAGRSFLIISQQASLADVNWVRQLSSIIFMNRVLIPIREDSKITINDYLKYFMPKRRGQILYFGDDDLLSIDWKLPQWWKKEYSAPYSHFSSKAESYRCALELLEDGLDSDSIVAHLKLRNCTSIDYPMLEWLKMSAPSDLNKRGSQEIIDFIEKDSEKALQEI